MSKITSETIVNAIETAEAKALATMSQDGINVVPVSMVRVVDGKIWLFDFFMNKTAANLKNNPIVAFTAWSKMVGVQVKASAKYITEGQDFEAAVAWVFTQNPARVVKGLIILQPTELFDISPGGAFSVEDLTC